MSTPARRKATGLRQFLGPEQQRDWMEGRTDLPDADERAESLEQRFGADGVALLDSALFEVQRYSNRYFGFSMISVPGS